MATPLLPYYQNLPPSIGQRFRNLDDDDVFAECDRALRSPSTRNFVVDFGGAPEDHGQAWCAVDIDPDDHVGIRALLSAKRPENGSLRTRWINIFSPYEERNLVATITQFYNFSPRLTNVITTPPIGAPGPAQSPPPTSRPVSMRARLFNRGDSRDVETASPESTGRHAQNDLLGDNIGLENLRSRRTKGGGLSELSGNYMDLVQSVWHFHAVEWGGRYICTGFNHLHQVPNAQKETSDLSSKHLSESDDSDSDIGEPENFDKGNYAPEGRRVWSWLILCDDGTVISIHEPLGPTSLPSLQKIRRNPLTVFRSLSLSKLATSSPQAAIVGGGLDDLPFRMPSHDLSNISGGPSLLMYYLFDDWHSMYPFVLRAGHPYSTQMRALRNEMHADPRLTHLARLNHLTRQLAILRRMYETRKIILENILYRHENVSRASRTTHTMHGTRSPSPDDFQHQLAMGNPHVLGVKLHDLAITKFERLRDRIRLYVLGELDSLLVEKDELENLTFNLISLKQAGTVELLTRVTIWLTLFTFLCLPLTLVTGYFSMQLKDVEGVYDLKAFWGSAGVSVAVTIVVLWTVARVGGAEAGVLWRGFRNFWGGWGSVKREREMKKGRRRRERRRRREASGSWATG